jgi:carbamate kinase
MLSQAGVLVIASGGGGIPVVKGLDGLRGVEAVIDKDLASELLAEEVGASVLMLMTDVEKVKLHYGTLQESEISRMDRAQAERYLDEGHFPEGSMGPKVQAAVRFVTKGGEVAIISSIDRIVDALNGKTGTVIVK